MFNTIKNQTQTTRKSYAQTLLKAQNMIKQYRSNNTISFIQSQIEHNILQNISNIVEYMSQFSVYQRTSYQRSVIILDNILVLHKNMLTEIQIPEQFINNLKQYFYKIVRLSQNQSQNQSNRQKIQNTVYSCLYLILLLIHKSNSNQNLKKQLINNMFNKQFISQFTKINYQLFDKKVIRVICIILAYLTRNKIISKQVKKQVKNMLLQLIIQCKEDITIGYLIVILKNMVHVIALTQIHKYKLIQFVFKGLNSEQPQTVKNSLLAIQQFLNKHKSLSSNILKLKLMKHFDLNISKHPQICLSILSTILPHVEQQKISLWFNTYLNHVVNNQNYISYIHIRILVCLSKYVETKLWIHIIESGYIWKIQEIQNKKDMNLKSAISQFRKQFMNKFRQFDPNLLSIYENFKAYKTVKEIKDFY